MMFICAVKQKQKESINVFREIIEITLSNYAPLRDVKQIKKAYTWLKINLVINTFKYEVTN